MVEFRERKPPAKDMIAAELWVEKEGQKGIIIGEGWVLMRRVTTWELPGTNSWPRLVGRQGRCGAQAAFVRVPPVDRGVPRPWRLPRYIGQGQEGMAGGRGPAAQARVLVGRMRSGCKLRRHLERKREENREKIQDLSVNDRAIPLT